MGWYSTWKIEFNKNANGEFIDDLWDQNQVDVLAEEQEKFSDIEYHGVNEAIVTIKYGCYCGKIASELFDLYKCPMKITLEDSVNNIVRCPDYYPSQFAYDSEIENMITIVVEKNNKHKELKINKNNYTRKARLELLAKTMFDIHYKTFEIEKEQLDCNSSCNCHKNGKC